MKTRREVIEEAAFKATTNRNRGTEECWIEGAQFADANPPGTSGDFRCEHDVHGYDCVQCFPSGGPNLTGDDERDAEEYAKDPWHKTGHYIKNIEMAFLAGRKGMVPVSEVERLKTQRVNLVTSLRILGESIDRRIAEAVKAAVLEERKRCAVLASTLKHEQLDPIMHQRCSILQNDIINPQDPK